MTLRWKDEDHIMTPENITKLSFIAAKEDHPLYKLPTAPRHLKPRASKCGPVIWIMKDGKPVNCSNLMKGEDDE